MLPSLCPTLLQLPSSPCKMLNIPRRNIREMGKNLSLVRKEGTELKKRHALQLHDLFRLQLFYENVKVLENKVKLQHAE